MTTDSTKSSGNKTLWIILAVCLLGFGTVAALVVVALAVFGYKAAARAKEARMQVEQEQLTAALLAYKQSFIEFPPANAPDQVRRHARRAWPRYSGDMAADLKEAKLDLANLDAREALVFWLGGLPSLDGGKELTGFHRDPQNPLQRGTAGDRGNRTLPMFDFDSSRLTDSDQDGWLEYSATSPGDGESRWFVYDADAHRVKISGPADK